MTEDIIEDDEQKDVMEDVTEDDEQKDVTEDIIEDTESESDAACGGVFSI